jgi:hypothetical protein
MQPLQLPPYPFKITHTGGKKRIFDPVRRKHLILTPEEWVRQHFLQFLINQKGFPKGLLRIEASVAHSKRRGRYDALFVNRKGSPLVLIECKAPEVPISRETFYQIARYNSKLNVPYLALTNGLEHYFLKIETDTNKISILDEFPDYKDLA